MKIFELTAILKVIAGLEFYILVEYIAYLAHHLLNIGIAHVHTYHYAALGGIAINLQRAIHEVDCRHFAHRHLQAVAGAHIQAIEV